MDINSLKLLVSVLVEFVIKELTVAELEQCTGAHLQTDMNLSDNKIRTIVLQAG